MRIAQVSPLYERVPPKHYGGTERIVSYLTEELVRAGHEVTLYASGDSITSARLVGEGDLSLRENRNVSEATIHHYLLLERVFRDLANFDVIHFHLDYLHFPFSRRQNAVQLTTLHGRLDLPDLLSLYQEYPEMAVNSISDAQRGPLPWLRWQGTVLHGLPEDLYRFHPGHQSYLAFLGRVSPEKGLDSAIEIARRVGKTLKVAAKVDRADQEYFEKVIAPLLANSPGVEFIGEIGDAEKNDFLGGAEALLFPINWPEPFGLVMIEAMACGTPVVAFNRGSVPEVIENGINGFVVDGVEQAVDAVASLTQISRRSCRQAFQVRFSASRMARDYLQLYESLLSLTPHPFWHREQERVTVSRGRLQSSSGPQSY